MALSDLSKPWPLWHLWTGIGLGFVVSIINVIGRTRYRARAKS
ncbi:hypothetical protein HD595_005861 [Nonomuraea roseoviolacea subsp. carminata]|uniref:Uncharacterized protein n=1 Tax=Nonomuraea roseoviolacea subsp. carminata TaxID=160689 RepID=A0ABT1K6V2_9ACTN|nr:hypothetical protein [Nonomuraea roseoviolacea subsp. carminata]